MVNGGILWDAAAVILRDMRAYGSISVQYAQGYAVRYLCITPFRVRIILSAYPLARELDGVILITFDP